MNGFWTPAPRRSSGFHLPGFHFGTGLLSYSHMGASLKVGVPVLADFWGSCACDPTFTTSIASACLPCFFLRFSPLFFLFLCLCVCWAFCCFVFFPWPIWRSCFDNFASWCRQKIANIRRLSLKHCRVRSPQSTFCCLQHILRLAAVSQRHCLCNFPVGLAAKLIA